MYSYIVLIHPRKFSQTIVYPCVDKKNYLWHYLPKLLNQNLKLALFGVKLRSPSTIRVNEWNNTTVWRLLTSDSSNLAEELPCELQILIELLPPFFRLESMDRKRNHQPQSLSSPCRWLLPIRLGTGQI